MHIFKPTPAVSQMKKILALVLATFTFGLVGCATYKSLEPINGSKADGTVTLSYQYGWLEDPQVDWDLANLTAQHRCSGSFSISIGAPA